MDSHAGQCNGRLGKLGHGDRTNAYRHQHQRRNRRLYDHAYGSRLPGLSHYRHRYS